MDSFNQFYNDGISNGAVFRLQCVASVKLTSNQSRVGMAQSFPSVQQAANQWTWLAGSNNFNKKRGIPGTKGVPSVANYPSGRRKHATALHSNEEVMYIFGGYGNTFSLGEGTSLHHRIIGI